ncbi:M56 family metallopeptidase [Fulvivirgaceae bacterium BMA10]|uniref:M56 family metallopeptidase n=1 Tax=Splendidivirga corallicola TaxID=3051826 RepID=A0ABT8L197_9BACT|nr:M56 family metallopeptidase [Fulvivirgaceae bacterium BMA10]
MNELIIYFIKSSICLAAFHFFYKFFLKKENCLHFNRLYLVLGTILSLVIPFLKIPLYFGAEPIANWENLNIIIESTSTNDLWQKNQNPVITPVVPLTWQEITGGLYFVGLFVFTFRFAFRIHTIFKIVHSHRDKKEQRDGYQLILTKGKLPTFSFFKYLFLDNTFTDQNVEAIIRHEEVHIKQWHSLDKIFLEIVSLVFWFNPLMIAMKNNIEEVHEFLADAEAVQNGHKKDYARMLINQAFLKIPLPFANYFNKSLIKRRIEMLNSLHRKVNIIRPLLSLPLLSLIFFFVACEKENIEKAETRVMARQLVQNGEGSFLTVPASEEFQKYIKGLERHFPDRTFSLGIANQSVLKELGNNSEYHKPLNIHFSRLIDEKEFLDLNVSTSYEENSVYLNMRPAYAFVFSYPKGYIKFDEHVYDYVDQMPYPTIGYAALNENIAGYLDENHSSLVEKINGEVQVEFVINQHGHIINSKIVKGLDDLPLNTDSRMLVYGAAIKAVSQTDGLWETGKERGIPKNVKMVLSIKF